ncbi:MAG: right-handed parallel beta-helix repeat-containing protein [Saprospirales bacterium]|nr:right-handed parallel beta-helix repeat-containing protein [Saprospirales bacterium]
MDIDLNSTTSDGSTAYSYVWDGPDSYSSILADPVPFPSILTSAGVYNVTVTDGNGCTATASTTVVVPTSGACVLNDDTNLLYPTITQAIDATATLNGHTLLVPAGTWAEDIIVDKELTIKGPNWDKNPCSDARVAEAIVVPATAAISTGEIFHVAASNVTITGFTIDGDNTALNSGYTSTNGADIDAAEGVTVYETGINNLTVTNNILQNLSYFGVTLYDYPAGVASTGHTISNNKFQNFGTYDATSGISFWGGGVLLYNNQYAAVTDNCMTNLRMGVQTGNFYQANPCAATFQEIKGNTMSVRRRGIFHNLAYPNASAYTLSNNAITGIMNANETVWDGILLSSLSVPSTSSNNTINGTGITNPSEGYEVWNVKNTFPAVISGGSVSNVNTGLFVNNYEGYNSDAGDGAHASVTGLSITPNASGTGIRVLDSPSSTAHANVQLTIGAGITVTGGTNGLVVENANASIVGATLNNLSFTGTTGNYIELVANSGDLDGTAVSFDGNTGATATLAQNFAIEDKIVHKIDDGALGYVSVKADHDFVTVNSFISPATTIASIQRGVDAASNGYTVNVAAGTDTDNVTVDNEVSILGAGQGLTFVYPLSSNPNPCSGASLCPGASNVMLVQANNVSIQELTIDGDNPALTSGLVAGGADLDARNGIITNHNAGTFNNLLVNNVTVKNIYLRGIYASSGGTFLFSNNTVDNVQGELASIAMFNHSGSGAFTGNMVSNANDGIVSNYSTGTTYSGNTVTLSASGIHTDNNSGSGDIIQNNTVTNSTSDGYGIWVYSPFVTVQVKENTVTNVDVGLANARQNAAVTTLFERNTVDGMNKPGSVGVYQTTSGFGWGDTDVSGLYINNFIKNNDEAFNLEYQTGLSNTITVNDNSITGNTTGVALNDLGGTLVEDFTCNWWGSATAATVASAAAASTNFDPWLVNGTDDNLGTAGFQPVAGACAGTPVVIDLVVPDPIICGETTGSLEVTFSGGTAPYDIAWTGGSATGVSSPYTIASLAAGTYGITVTDAFSSTATTTATVLYLPVSNGVQYYATIQEAIDAATSGDVLSVCDGSYAENLVVDKALSLQGANFGILHRISWNGINYFRRRWNCRYHQCQRRYSGWFSNRCSNRYFIDGIYQSLYPEQPN